MEMDCVARLQLYPGVISDVWSGASVGGT